MTNIKPWYYNPEIEEPRTVEKMGRILDGIPIAKYERDFIAYDYLDLHKKLGEVHLLPRDYQLALNRNNIKVLSAEDAIRPLWLITKFLSKKPELNQLSFRYRSIIWSVTQQMAKDVSSFLNEDGFIEFKITPAHWLYIRVEKHLQLRHLMGKAEEYNHRFLQTQREEKE